MAHAAATTTVDERRLDEAASLEEERLDDLGVDDHDLAELDDDELDAAIRDGSVIEVAEARQEALADPAEAVRTWGRRLPAVAG